MSSTPPLQGRTVALAEGRQLEELVRLLERDGATALRFPLLSILDAPDAEPVEAWLRQLIEGRFDLVVLMTGEAVRRLTGFAERAGLRESFVQSLARTPTLTRGPKPVKALKELGVTPSRVAPSPTSTGVITALKEQDLTGKVVGVTLYGAPNPELEEYLTGAGAQFVPVLSYVYAPATEDERVVELILRLQSGGIDALLFTSSPQIERLYTVAEQRGLSEALQTGLNKTFVAAVGPLVADSLRERGAPVHLCPEQGWVMTNLVKQLGKALKRS